LKRLIVVLLLAMCSCFAQAANVALLESYSGKINFVGVQATMRTQANTGNACAITNANLTRSLTIPAGATVVAAHLFWAGSTTDLSTPDYSVTLNGTTVTAATNRRHTLLSTGDYYFAHGQDVTAIISPLAAGATHTITFGSLTVNNTAACDVKAVVGGFSLLVIYSTATETFRVLNLYEGLQEVYDGVNVSLTLSNFLVPNPRNGATGKVAHITWEGDPDLSTGENLTFNGSQLSDATNPVGTQFNSKSSIDNDLLSYGVDFDSYTIDSQLTDGMSSATTVYSTDADFVLLHGEIIMVPNVPISDLEISIARASAMVIGKANSFTYTVKNLGSNATSGTITVSHTYPSAVVPSTVAGQDWTCNVAGQVVTCTYTAAVTSGTTLPLITAHFTPVSITTNTNTVTVAYSSTTSFDNETGNNSASIVSTVASAGYVFTSSQCFDGVPLGTAGQCAIKVFPTLKAGDTLSTIYITYLNGGVPTKIHNQNRDVGMYFGLSCHNPTTPAAVGPVIPVFTGTPLAQRVVCRSNGAVTAMTENNITFRGGYASSLSSYSFTYDDVGEVELYMGDGSNTGSSGKFVVRPDRITLTSVTRNSDNDPVAPQATTTGSPVWIKTGDTISMTIRAETTAGAVTPNFGREKVGTTESFAITLSSELSDMQVVPSMSGSFDAISGGTASGTGFSFDDAGIVGLTPGILSGNYLNGGNPSGTKVNVGRITPSKFKTVVTGPITTCKTNMGCGALTAAYSLQPFTVTVTPLNSAGNNTKNYKGGIAHTVNLTAFTTMGGTTAATGAMGSASLANTLFTYDTNTQITSATTTTPTFSFPFMFDGATPRNVSNWNTPTTIYIRAADATDTAVTSSQGVSSVEGGIRIVNGRLDVPSKTGSELVRMPLQLRAQFWNGTGWEDSTTDSISVLSFVAPNAPTFLNCGTNFPDCTTPLSLTSTANQTLSNGVTTIRLNAPGANKTGGVTMQMNSPAWLPSTRGRLVFGLYRPPLDYIREVH
jgi:hypothetical protein